MKLDETKEEVKTGIVNYYDCLPERTAPKTEFVKRVAEKCGVDTATVRTWIKGKNRPSDSTYLTVLSKESGIPENELFV